MPKPNDYKPDNPEYDFWNDKNLYPSLRQDEEDFSKSQRSAIPENHKTTFGTIFAVTFVWLILLAPFVLFFTWKDWIVQVIFWGGIAVILITYALAFYNALQEDKRKKK